MKTIRATFDGQVFVPQQPVDLPEGSEVDITMPDDKNETASEVHNDPSEPSVWEKIMAKLDKMPDDSNYPPDYSQQIDHYLYGTPKKENS